MEFDASLPWREVRGDGFNAHVGPVMIARAGEAEWRAALVLDRRHINVGGVCHGGVLMALADIAMGTSTYEAAGGHPCATIEMDCHFLAAAREGQRVLAATRQLRRVRELSFMECDLWAGGRQVMRASGIWKHLASRAPGQPGPRDGARGREPLPPAESPGRPAGYRPPPVAARAAALRTRRPRKRSRDSPGTRPVPRRGSRDPCGGTRCAQSCWASTPTLARKSISFSASLPLRA